MRKINDVFIGYRRDKGKDLANALRLYLDANGFKVFYDLGSIYAGEFRDVLCNAVKQSSLFVLLITEGSIERFKDENDVSRMELETAIAHGIDILPITIIGEDMFAQIKEEDAPKCVKSLSDYNVRFYTNETQTDTFDYIINLCKKNREIKFKKIDEGTDKGVLEVIHELTEVDSQSLNPTIRDLNGIDESYLYTGTLRRSKPYGQGTLTNKLNSLVYEIDFLGNMSLDGEGRIYEGSELVYEGKIKKLKPYGYGVEHRNGDVYKGIFMEGKKEVQGSLRKADGYFYEGEFKADVIDGNGYQRNADGEEYKGEFKRGVREGQGVMVTKDGIKYEGTFHNNPTYIVGTKEDETRAYIGRFDSDLRPDKNIKIFDKESSRQLFDGYYENGKKEGIGEVALKGDYIKSLNIPEFNLTAINYSLELKEEDYYILRGIYESDKLQITKPFKIIDTKGNTVFDKINTEYIEYKDIDNNVKVELNGNSVKVEEDNIKYSFRYKEGLIGIECIYNTSETVDKKGSLFVDVNDISPTLKGSGDGYSDIGDDKYEIKQIITVLPNIFKDKLIAKLSIDTIGVENKITEGIVIEI